MKLWDCVEHRVGRVWERVRDDVGHGLRNGTFSYVFEEVWNCVDRDIRNRMRHRARKELMR